MKCAICNKKIPLHLQNYPCKCNIVFCIDHRLPEHHGCTYYYDTDGKHKIIDSKLEVSKVSNKCIKI